MSARAARILAEADCIAAEDTRHTAQLLNSLGIRNRLISSRTFPAGTGRGVGGDAVGGQNIALVTDARHPYHFRSGEQLTKLAAEQGIEILGVPGACAAIAALTVSALDAGNLSLKDFCRVTRRGHWALQTAISHPYTTILYESPHQLRKTRWKSWLRSAPSAPWPFAKS